MLQTTEKPTTLVVIGLGYVGLPLAQVASEAGMEVIGLDTMPVVVEGLEAGTSHVDDISNEDVRQMLRAGFRATTDQAVIKQADAVVICVPTPLSIDGNPDLGAILAASEAVAAQLEPGTLVVLESTTFPGTTQDIVAPVLETSGLTVGVDFHLAFSPERVDPGNKVFNIKNTPKVVGGVTTACTEAASLFYSAVVDQVVRAKGAKEAETTKLLENTYRHINIALVNEMARVCHEMDIDVWNVIDCASTKPFGFQPFYPGPGVGGHCIPIDPNYFSYSVKRALGYPLRFVELAQEINATMPSYVFRRAQDLLNRRARSLRTSRVVLIGVTYKANIADQRESPAEALAVLLHGAGAEVMYHDPFVREWCPADREIVSLHDLSDAAHLDLAIVLQHHSVVEPEKVLACADLVLDTRGVIRGTNVEWL